jgi:hypothetical protein
MNERIAGRFMDHVIAGMEGVLGELGYLRQVCFFHLAQKSSNQEFKFDS